MITFDEINFNDPATLKIIADGGAEDIPIFFLQNTFNPFPYYRRIPNLSFDDLVVINAIGYSYYGDEQLEKYIYHRNNPSKIPVNLLSAFTKETAGLIIFREQIKNIIKHFTNWPDEKVDKMRRDLGKKDIRCKEPFLSCFKDQSEGGTI